MTEPAPGHNSKPLVMEYKRRFETIAQDLKENQEEMRDLKKEGANAGIDMKAIAVLVKQESETKAQREKRTEFEQTLDVYRVTLGMID